MQVFYSKSSKTREIRCLESGRSLSFSQALALGKVKAVLVTWALNPQCPCVLVRDRKEADIETWKEKAI